MRDKFNAILQLDGYSLHDTRNAGSASIDGYALDGYLSHGSLTSEAVYVGDCSGYSVTVSCPATGSPNGTAKLQGCNDAERGNYRKSDAKLVNWFDVASGGDRLVSGSVTNASVVHLTDPNCRYRWFRVVYTRSSGIITITVKAQGKASE